MFCIFSKQECINQRLATPAFLSAHLRLAKQGIRMHVAVSQWAMMSDLVQLRNMFIKFIRPWKPCLPSGKQPPNYGKIHHFQWVNPIFQWSFSIANCNSHYQRVSPSGRFAMCFSCFFPIDFYGVFSCSSLMKTWALAGTPPMGAERLPCPGGTLHFFGGNYSKYDSKP